jgi:hypothetical protein
VFATPEDIATRYGRELNTVEAATAEFLLEGATALIAQAADKDDAWADNLDPVPRLLKIITVELVCRAFPNPESLAGLTEQLGSYQYSKRFKAGTDALTSDLMLTEPEERLVRRAVHGTLSGSVPLRSIATRLTEETTP